LPWPFLLLPLSLVPMFLPTVFSFSLASNSAVYLPCLALSLVIARWMDHPGRGGEPGARENPAPLVLLVTVCFSLFFWLAGWAFSVHAGATVGDEGHYIIQAISLNQDQDLDILNNLSEWERDLVLHHPGGRMREHISPYSRDGHYYSWHPYGISLLMAPLEGFGLGGRHLALGIVAGLGSGGVLLACFMVGASVRTSLLCTILFSLSSFWGIYACRALPETAGGTLAIWLLVALFLYRHAPLRALLLGGFCCALMPWFHTRFGPLAALGGLFFLLLIRRSRNPRPGRRAQAVLFCSMGLVAALFYFTVQFSLFKGGSPYPIKSVLLSYLPGMWKVVFGWRSITYMLPMFAWLCAATVWVAWHDREWRWPACMAVALFFIVLVTSCTYYGWGGGSSPFGRYLLAVSPLFVPFGARVYERCSPFSRWLLIFLGLVSCAYFLLVLANLDELYRHFIDPRGNLAYIFPEFSGLSNPFVAPWFGPVFFLLCAAALWWRPGRVLGPILAGGLFLAAVLAHQPENLDRGPELSWVTKRANTLLMEGIDLRRAKVWSRPDRSRTWRITDVFLNRLAFYEQKTIGQLTTARLDRPARDNVISQPLLPVNDWQGRPLRWATLVPPFAYGGPGIRLLCLDGARKGSARLRLAVAELGPGHGRAPLEKAVDWPGDENQCRCFDLAMEGRGQTFLLARLEGGEGELHVRRLAWYPVGKEFLRRTGVASPCQGGRLEREENGNRKEKRP